MRGAGAVALLAALLLLPLASTATVSAADPGTSHPLVRALELSVNAVRDHLAKLGLPPTDPLWAKLDQASKMIGEVKDLLSKGEYAKARRLAMRIFSMLGAIVSQAHKKTGKARVLEPGLRILVLKARAAVRALMMLSKRVAYLRDRGLLSQATAGKLLSELAAAKRELGEALRNTLKTLRSGEKPSPEPLVKALNSSLKTLKSVRGELLKLVPNEMKEGLRRALSRESLRMVRASEHMEALAERVNGDALLKASSVLREASKALGELVSTSSEAPPGALLAALRLSRCLEAQAAALAFKEVPALSREFKRALGAAHTTVVMVEKWSGNVSSVEVRVAKRVLMELRRAVNCARAGALVAAHAHAKKALESSEGLVKVLAQAPQEVRGVAKALEDSCRRLESLLARMVKVLGPVLPPPRTCGAACVKALLSKIEGVSPEVLEKVLASLGNTSLIREAVELIEETASSSKEPYTSMLALLKCELEMIQLVRSTR